MFCRNCGAEIADNAAFCPKCGTKVCPDNASGNNFSSPNHQPSQGAPYGYQPGGYYQPVKKAGSAPGKIMLIIAGILVLIGGLVTIGADAQVMPYAKYIPGIGGALAFEMIYAIVMIAVGILAIVYCSRKDKGQLVFGLGVLVVILRVIDWILAAALFEGLIDAVNAAAVIFGFICPILIAVGGYLNKKH